MKNRKGLLISLIAAAAAIIICLGNIAPPIVEPQGGGEGGEGDSDDADLPRYLPPSLAEYLQENPSGFDNVQQPPSYNAPMVQYPGRWYNRTPLPIERCDTPNGATVRDATDSLYLFGGENYNTSYHFNFKYDVSTDRFTLRAPIPVTREEFGLGVWNGKIYAAGGHNWTLGDDHQSHNDTLCYDTISNNWSYKSSIPYPVTYPSSATVGNRIYVFGGWEIGIPPMPVWDYTQIYDPANDTWSQGTPMLTGRTWASAAVLLHDGVEKIYVVGGYNGKNSLLNSTEMYNPKTDSWTEMAPMPTPRACFAVAVVNNKMYCIGGTPISYAPGDIPYKMVEVYDPEYNKWYTDTPMPTPRADMGASSADNKIFVIAGWTPTQNILGRCLDTNEMFVPAQMNVSAKAFPNPVMSNSTTLVTVSLSEYWGAGTPGANLSIKASLPGGAISAVTDHGDGNYTFNYTAPLASTTMFSRLNITAMKPGYPRATGKLTIIVHPAVPMGVTVLADPATVVSEETSNITVKVDDMGYPVTLAAVELNCSAGGSFTQVVDQGNGNYTSVYTAPRVAVQTPAVIHANATRGGNVGGSGSLSISIIPPPEAPKPPLSVAVTASPQSITRGTQTTLHIAVSSNSTPVTGASITVRDNSGGGAFAPPVEIGGGIYDCVYSAPNVSQPKTVTITANASKAGYAPAEGSAAINVNLNPTLAVAVSCNATEAKSGGSVSLAVNVTDPVTGAGIGSASVAMDDGSAGGSFGSVSSDGLGNFFVDYDAPYVSSPASVMLVANATHAGYNQGSGWAYLTVNPMALSIAVSTSKPSATSGDSIAVFASVSSAGSPVSAATVTFSDGGAGGSFSTVSDNGDGTYTSSYTTPAVSSDTQVTITGSAALAGYADATATASVTVSPMTGATLKGTVTATPSSLQSGEQSTVTVTVTADSIPVAGAQVSLNCGGQGSIDPASGLTDAAGTLVANYTAPDVTAQTIVKITASFSKGGYVTGSATANITVDPAMPDLAVESSGIAVKKISDGTYEANITVKNLGQASVGDATYRVYLDEILQGGDRAISVPGHGQASALVSLSGMPEGTHNITVCLDPAGAIAESNETNNNASAQFSVAAGSGGGGMDGISTWCIPALALAVLLGIMLMFILLGAKRRKKKDDQPPEFARPQDAAPGAANQPPPKGA